MSNQSERSTGSWPSLILRALRAGAIALTLSLIGISGRAEAFASHAVGPGPFIAPALVAEATRQPGYDDFLRLVFANIAPPTQLGGPNAYRVFFGATAYYEPPVTITQFANFSGIPVDPTVPLFAMRCIPPTGSIADPALATWPNLITRILEDYAANPPATGSVDEAIEEIAETFADPSSQVLTQPLAYALSIGEEFFENYESFTAAQMQGQMSRRFGTFITYIGLGYAAEGTASSPTWDSAQTMNSLATPDFILKNVSLAEAGCRCIEVPSTVPNRDNLKLDPNFISSHGGNGSCVEANLWGQDDPY